MNTLTIGKLASQAGVGVETVRFYERSGLLDQPARPARGFRRYPDAAIKRLRFIRQARDLGFNLDEIGDLLALRLSPSATCENVRDRTQEKIIEIDRRIDLLSTMRASLSELLASCDLDGPATDCPILDHLEDS